MFLRWHIVGFPLGKNLRADRNYSRFCDFSGGTKLRSARKVPSGGKPGSFNQFLSLNSGAKKQLEIEQEAWERTKNEMLQEKDKLTNEIQAKEEIINFQEQRIQEVAREMTLSLMRAGLQANTNTARGNATDKLLESKQLLAKLHLQYEYEMEKLRAYVKRESERQQAETRRLDTEFKTNLNNIYRETSVIYRAVNRFKECLAALFDRESK